MGVEQSYDLLVEGDEGLLTEPFSLVGDDAINKVAAGIERRKACSTAGRFTSTLAAASNALKAADPSARSRRRQMPNNYLRRLFVGFFLPAPAFFPPAPARFPAETARVSGSGSSSPSSASMISLFSKGT